ncbi:methyltransferase family protein [Paenibacillus taihuensis]|uniref:Methyltransferase family protein n=1 Tax=Paenibacillus taihuensis TaxID=1156355 RepID=A0A3D9SDF9_9BACL|nr:methyltransferase domain-containing protein [Paenibacillus taihuensis]REE89051.1 methyltransferase family protein [Paenibacillus taihuensis]
MRIDLGCGAHKFHDCYGIDRVDLPGVDLVHDFNERLPLKDHSVSFVMASHSLEYADHLMDVLKELYRVCRHKAMICMIVPYAHVSTHMVNPQFKQLFNEHSPRYWTPSPDTILTQDEYNITQNVSWSAPEIEVRNEKPMIDLRLMRMEFFYFPAYNSGFDQQELSLLRQSQLNVANQMMMHLIVVKQPVTQSELQLIKDSETFEEPEEITELRAASAAKEGKEKLFYLEHMLPIIREQIENKDKNENENTNMNKKKAAAKKTTGKKTGKQPGKQAEKQSEKQIGKKQTSAALLPIKHSEMFEEPEPEPEEITELLLEMDAELESEDEEQFVEKEQKQWIRCEPSKKKVAAKKPSLKKAAVKQPNKQVAKLRSTVPNNTKSKKKQQSTNKASSASASFEDH